MNAEVVRDMVADIAAERALPADERELVEDGWLTAFLEAPYPTPESQVN